MMLLYKKGFCAFSPVDLCEIHRFYSAFPIWDALRPKLNGTQERLLMKMEELKRELNLAEFEKIED